MPDGPVVRGFGVPAGVSLAADIAAVRLVLPSIVRKTITFTGAANLGAIGNVPLFTVTGEVLVEKLVPFCTVNVVGAGPISLGVTGSTALFLANTVGTAIVANTFWTATTPVANGVALPAAFKDIVITDNIVGTVSVADLTAGAVRLDLYWSPLSSDGAVVAA